MLGSYSIVIVVMSLFELILFSYDKVASASSRFRIPVYTLMIPIGFGGALGALASMFLYRHKNTNNNRVQHIVATPTIKVIQEINRTHECPIAPLTESSPSAYLYTKPNKD